MKKPLSVSGATTYWECPAKFDLHYNKRIRPVTQMSYFIFGSAVDKAINALLEGKLDPLGECESELKRLLSEQVEYLAADYDGELLDEATKERLLQDCRIHGYSGTNVDALASTLMAKPYRDLSDNQKKALSLCCHASLKVKASLMLDAYKSKVLPRLSNIRDVQKEYRWKDAHGNEFVGIIEFRATLDGWDLITDNKTSSNPDRDYGIDSVRTSIQLSAYCSQTGDTHAAYIVLGKAMRKNRVKTCSVCGNNGTGKRHKTCEVETAGVRCNGEWIETIQPEAEVLIRRDEVPAEEIAIVQDALTGVANAVACGSFPKNLKSCRKQFGPKTVLCPYYQYCRNGSMEGLELVSEKEKEK